jgi:signal peptidase I|tara:strand:- start:1854 stop:2219 length:366 start_codon:yes stop_codon:yes gene_type:complete
MFIVDNRDKDIKRGDLVAFKFNKEDKNFDKGLNFIKIAAGVPGDEIKFSPNEMLVNRVESKIAGMTHAINFLQLNPKEYERQITLNENEFFMVGETIYSYDSRFWGPINEEDILGKAYAIF